MYSYIPSLKSPAGVNRSKTSVMGSDILNSLVSLYLERSFATYYMRLIVYSKLIAYHIFSSISVIICATLQEAVLALPSDYLR